MLKYFLATILVVLTAGIAGCQIDPMTVPTINEVIWGGKVCLPIDRDQMHLIWFQLVGEPSTLVAGSMLIPADELPQGAELFQVQGRQDLFIFSLPEEINKVDADGWFRTIYPDGTPYWTKIFRPGPELGLIYQVKFEFSPVAVLFCEIRVLRDFGD